MRTGGIATFLAVLALGSDVQGNEEKKSMNLEPVGQEQKLYKKVTLTFQSLEDHTWLNENICPVAAAMPQMQQCYQCFVDDLTCEEFQVFESQASYEEYVSDLLATPFGSTSETIGEVFWDMDIGVSSVNFANRALWVQARKDSVSAGASCVMTDPGSSSSAGNARPTRSSNGKLYKEVTLTFQSLEDHTWLNENICPVAAAMPQMQQCYQCFVDDLTCKEFQIFESQASYEEYVSDLLATPFGTSQTIGEVFWDMDIGVSSVNYANEALWTQARSAVEGSGASCVMTDPVV